MSEPKIDLMEAISLLAREKDMNEEVLIDTIEEALKAKEAGEPRTILFNLSGNGYLDLAAYDSYNKGQIRDYDYASGTEIQVPVEA